MRELIKTVREGKQGCYKLHHCCCNNERVTSFV